MGKEVTLPRFGISGEANFKLLLLYRQTVIFEAAATSRIEKLCTCVGIVRVIYFITKKKKKTAHRKSAIPTPLSFRYGKFRAWKKSSVIYYHHHPHHSSKKEKRERENKDRLRKKRGEKNLRKGFFPPKNAGKRVVFFPS